MAVAGRRATWFGAALKQLSALRKQVPAQGGVACACHKSTYSPLPNDYNWNKCWKKLHLGRYHQNIYKEPDSKVELALTSDGRTIVCYHPSIDVPYEHSKPLPRPDPVHNKEETHDQVLKTRLKQGASEVMKGPTMEELSQMFYTTKHRWYPIGHKRRIQSLVGYDHLPAGGDENIGRPRIMSSCVTKLQFNVLVDGHNPLDSSAVTKENDQVSQKTHKAESPKRSMISTLKTASIQQPTDSIIYSM